MRAAVKTADLPTLMESLCDHAREAYVETAEASNAQKDNALVQAAFAIRMYVKDVLAANTKDMALAREKGLNTAMLDRLALDEKRIEAMAQTLETVATLPDPVNKTLAEWTRPNGLVIQR